MPRTCCRSSLQALLSTLAIAWTIGCLSSVTADARTIVQMFTADTKPDHLETPGPFIIKNSDSLYIGTALLESGVDYRFQSGSGYFDLSSVALQEGDTLKVIYRPLPSWLMASYGRDLPPVQARDVPVPIATNELPSQTTRQRGSQVTLSGAKTFRFSARSAGSSEFGQSLDLQIAGELSPGVEISGTVSDRGYEPAYGTANSRLNELDKINLRLQSRTLVAQVGDITIGGRRSGVQGKSVSGASFELTYPTWQMSGAAARPRGRFTTVQLNGSDGFQGPYQVAPGSSGPIVPGSESVWLDGRKMERGANKDYTVDYPAGRITFTVARPIDSRSRIEVDFEPLSTDYKEELFAGGGGVSAGDSIVFVSVSMLREGDDRNQPVVGELSDFERDVLAQAGDGPATRPGVTVDTAGAYVLVVDSLPDSVYQYVGDGSGDYSVQFSFVGEGSGEYRYVGGDQYQFAGADAGDYSPVIILPAATRTDYFTVMAGSRTEPAGAFTIDLRGSRRDNNLWSSLDDGDNEGMYLDGRWKRALTGEDSLSFVRARYRRREVRFVSRERLDVADFARRFYLPGESRINADEVLFESEVALQPHQTTRVRALAELLDYRSVYMAKAGEASVEIEPMDRLQVRGDWRSVRSSLDSSAASGDGLVDVLSAGGRYSISQQLRVFAAGEHDRRRNMYFGEARGTRFSRLSAGAIRGDSVGYGERVNVEHYVEDTLVAESQLLQWQDELTRNRASVGSSRRIGDFSYDGQLTYQWLERPGGDETGFLSRASMQYQSGARKITANAAYVLSEERRNARGITYLEVEPGLGNYSLEDGEYVPDPDGNFIQVEEILSDVARVSRGEKSFYLSKDWSVVLVRLTSDVEEELKPEGERSALWILPFYADDNQPYLFYRRRSRADLRALPVRGFHAVNVLVSDEIERRDIASVARERHDSKAEVTLKQVVSQTFFEEGLELFRYDRDNYYSGSGDVDGFRASLLGRQVLTWGEVSLGGAYREAEDESGARSETLSSTASTRWRAFDRGEFRLSVEGYTQIISGGAAAYSYQLTGNRPGERGAIWNVSMNYGIRGGVRVNVSVSGRHSNDREGRVTGRGEVVAGF